MNWFWRVVLALLAGTAVYAACFFPFTRSGPPVGYSFLRRFVGEIPAVFLLISLPPTLAALLVYGVLTRRWYASAPRMNETLCRKCGYILRGISEPRCPECGEKI